MPSQADSYPDANAFSPPPNLPKGVQTAFTNTTSFMAFLLNLEIKCSCFAHIAPSNVNHSTCGKEEGTVQLTSL